MRVTWDPAKDLANRRKHRIDFAEASALFTSGDEYLELFDEQHSQTEDRFIAIGRISGGIVVIVWTEKDDGTVRIISARWATGHEQHRYRSHLKELE